MRIRPQQSRRPGTILPLAVISLVSMCGFVALAVDIGLVAVAKTQCQNAADAGAMAGARSLNGQTGQNLGSVGSSGTAMNNAMVTAQANKVLNSTVPQSSVALLFGAWHYDSTNQVFVAQFPPVSPDLYTLAQVTVSYSVQAPFAGVFTIIQPGFNSLVNVSAVAQAAHRPRDVGIVLDYSGSMNNESDLWNSETYLDNGSNHSTSGYTWPGTNNPAWTSNNAETVYPLFGHYSNEKNYSDYVHYANLLSPSADGSSPLSGSNMIGKCNISQAVQGVQAQVGDYYSNSRGVGAAGAFTSQPDSYASGTTSGQGDNYLYKSKNTSTGNYATTLTDVIGSSPSTTDQGNWKQGATTGGYKAYTSKTFNGYTVGPRYWGKTFFVWPPDPINDWRKQFFFESNGTTPCDDNTLLFKNSFPGYNDPPGNYVINYKAILNWIANTGTNPFPSQLRSCSVCFYSSIPTDVPASAYDHTQPNSNITDPSQRFWKEYIDWTLGVWRDPTGNIQHTQSPTCSMGPDFQFGTVQIKPLPTSAPSGWSKTPYMDPLDNPWRPRHRMWFGPMTMIQYMQDTGILPGGAHDISMYAMKNGVGGAITDIQNNHPNDLVSMILFSRPQYNDDVSGVGSFNNVQYNLSTDYSDMINSLWLPPTGTTQDVTPWDSNGVQTPHAHGDYDANTASSYGFMLAYNQFSSNSSLKTNTAGGLGRKGATRLIVYETDGMANQDSNPVSGFSNNGANNSYYCIRPGDTVDQGNNSKVNSNLLQVVEAICNKTDGTYSYTVPSGAPSPLGYPGYATGTKPVTIQCIAFGAIFEAPNSIQTSSVSLLQQISTIGGTVFPSSASDATNGYKWCIGTQSQRQAALQKAFTTILDSTVTVSLIQ